MFSAPDSPVTIAHHRPITEHRALARVHWRAMILEAGRGWGVAIIAVPRWRSFLAANYHESRHLRSVAQMPCRRAGWYVSKAWNRT